MLKAILRLIAGFAYAFMFMFMMQLGYGLEIKNIVPIIFYFAIVALIIDMSLKEKS